MEDRRSGPKRPGAGSSGGIKKDRHPKNRAPALTQTLSHPGHAECSARRTATRASPPWRLSPDLSTLRSELLLHDEDLDASAALRAPVAVIADADA